MRMFDLITTKKRGGELSEREITFIVNNFTNGVIPDYQMAAFLMAVCLRGMTAAETAFLATSMANSGEKTDLSAIAGIKADKHSTGGVGDKTTLVIAPILASLGVKTAKMSGKGLGHTGGTIDKLESIPGFKTELSREEFISIINKINVCIARQSGELAPADKKIYTLRDVTATVDSLPLIAASVMSKKIAAGSDCILLDVKTGGGAFMKTLDEAVLLSKTMVDIGKAAGKKTAAIITDMNTPLGNNIGNSLEIIEAVQTLKNKGPHDLTELCIELSAQTLMLAGIGGEPECRKMAEKSLESGAAFAKFVEMVKAQGGDERYILDTGLFEQSKNTSFITAQNTGYICSMDTETIGRISVILGAGREVAGDDIDYSAGIILYKKTGGYVTRGEPLAELRSSSSEKLKEVEERFLSTITISSDKPKDNPLVYKRIY